MKKILSVLSIVTAAVMVTVCVSCKKDKNEPEEKTEEKIDFRNATTDYIESFLGKDEAYFLSEAEKCGMIKEIEGRDRKFGRFRNSILGISADYNLENGKIIDIEYYIEDQKEENKKKNYEKFRSCFKNLNRKNYSAFKGFTQVNKELPYTCFKDINEFSGKLEMTDYIGISYINNSNCASVNFEYSGDIGHSPSGIYILNYLCIEFTSPKESEWYNHMKEYILKPCDE